MIENKEITENPNTLRNGNERGRGGARPGAGRKPKPKDLSLLQRTYEVLDEATLPALKAVVRLLRSRNEMTRLRAAQEILAKRIPDLKQDSAEQKPTKINIIYGYRGEHSEGTK